MLTSSRRYNGFDERCTTFSRPVPIGRCFYLDNGATKRPTATRSSAGFRAPSSSPQETGAETAVTANSNQAPRRHPWVAVYRCCLPALAGFAGPCCVGPNLQRHLTCAGSMRRILGEEFNPAVADCGSPQNGGRGTAGSPSSTTVVSLPNWAVLSRRRSRTGRG